jgi:hypothetical protein
VLDVSLQGDQIRIGERFGVACQRTLRIPEDGSDYPLPAGLGRLPVDAVEDLGRAAPASWRGAASFFIPLYQREALWLAFEGAAWKPNAVQVGLGAINALTGGLLNSDLSTNPQNYIVCPDQPWLDGVNAGEGFVRQFVALPLGSGATVEGQLTGAETLGGIQIRVYEPKPGRFPDKPASEEVEGPPRRAMTPALGVGAGGRIRQRIYPDHYGLDTWDTTESATARIYLLNSEQYHDLTGRPPPPTPIDALTYAREGLPWFELYDKDQGDLAAAEKLAGLKGAVDSERATRRRH